MADATTASLKADIATAYDVYAAELKLAGPNWEKKPAAGKEGEEAWCARQVAEHIGSASPFFGNAIAKVAGIEGPKMGQPSFADAASASAALPDGHAGLMAVINQLQDSQLGIETEFGPLGKTTLAYVVGIVAHHLNDHAAQLKALRG